MADLFENPLGLDGFEFIEFSAPEKGLLEPVFERMGFSRIARHRSKDVDLWRQGEINLIANYEPKSSAAYFAAEHGPSACGMAFRGRDARLADAHLLEKGAEPVAVQTGPMELHIPAIRGIGGAILYLVDRYADDGQPGSLRWASPFERGDNPEAHRSFCSSHAAAGFALMGLGLTCGPVWRRRWFLIGLVSGAVIGAGRIMQGGHYLSDIVFSFYAVWLTSELVAYAFKRYDLAQLPPHHPARIGPRRPLR